MTMTRLFRGDDSANVPEIDTPGWIAAGWSREPSASQPVTPADTPRKTLDERNSELKELDWEQLKELMESYKLPTTKPKGVSWAEWAIPKILGHEGYLP